MAKALSDTAKVTSMDMANMYPGQDAERIHMMESMPVSSHTSVSGDCSNSDARFCGMPPVIFVLGLANAAESVEVSDGPGQTAICPQMDGFLSPYLIV